MLFQNRKEAARLLAETSAAFVDYDRDGAADLFVMAKDIAAALHGEMDVVLVRKLRAPGNPEFAVGSVDESGWTYVADHAAAAGATPEYIEQEKQEQLATMRRRRAQ